MNPKITILFFLFIYNVSVAQVPLGKEYTGKASFYAQKFYGRKTASGEILNRIDLTVAHLTLPFGTMVEIENLSNHKWVVARVNDRGPYVGGVLLDLTDAVRKKIGITGTVPIKMMVVGDAGKVYLGRVDVTQNTNEIIKDITQDSLGPKIPMKNLKKKKGYGRKKHHKSKKR